MEDEELIWLADNDCSLLWSEILIGIRSKVVAQVLLMVGGRCAVDISIVGISSSSSSRAIDGCLERHDQVIVVLMIGQLSCLGMTTVMLREEEEMD